MLSRALSPSECVCNNATCKLFGGSPRFSILRAVWPIPHGQCEVLSTQVGIMFWARSINSCAEMDAVNGTRRDPAPGHLVSCSLLSLGASRAHVLASSPNRTGVEATQAARAGGNEFLRSNWNHPSGLHASQPSCTQTLADVQQVILA